jgi:hypothetical protein
MVIEREPIRWSLKSLESRVLKTQHCKAHIHKIKIESKFKNYGISWKHTLFSCEASAEQIINETILN